MRLTFMRLFLIGFMGAGKTSVGKRLAARLGYRFVDLDERIEEAAGLPVRAIFARLGEPGFRRLEGQQLAAVAAADDVVVACGGGTPEAAHNRAIMQTAGSVTVWLDASFETIVRRIDETARESRPMWASDEAARALHHRRSGVYLEAADVRVRIDPDASIDETVSRVERELRERQCAI